MKKNENTQAPVDNVVRDMQFRKEEAEALATKPASLTSEEFNQMGTALARLHEIRSTKSEGSILTRDRKNNAAALEKEGTELVNFLAEKFITHGQEFLGIYMVVKSEYEPLVNGFLPFFRRVAASCELQRQQALSSKVSS